jgi:hypothetical protein
LAKVAERYAAFFGSVSGRPGMANTPSKAPGMNRLLSTYLIRCGRRARTTVACPEGAPGLSLGFQPQEPSTSDAPCRGARESLSMAPISLFKNETMFVLDAR